MWKHVCLLLGLGLLIGQAHRTGAVTCYQGNHTTVTGEFPNRTLTCDTKDGELCVEKRRKNWESQPGYFELYFGCGKCGTFKAEEVECRECNENNCNTDYGTALVPDVTNLRLCYNSLSTKIGPMPVPVFCPKRQNCTSSENPDNKDHVLVGCQPHCEKLQWKGCEFCDSDLCNLKAPPANGSHEAPKAAVLPPPPPPLPPPPPPPPPPSSFEKSQAPKVEKLQVARAATKKSDAKPVSDKAALAAKSTAAAAEVARPAVLATVFAVVAALARAWLWQ